MSNRSIFPLLTFRSMLLTGLLSQPGMAEEFAIVSTEFAFQPKQIRIIAGHPFTLVLDNSGAVTEHGIFIPELNFHMLAKAGETIRQTLTFEEEGEYPFVCDLPGHTEAGMHGKFFVIE